jgi:hypothetical protein
MGKNPLGEEPFPMLVRLRRYVDVWPEEDRARWEAVALSRLAGIRLSPRPVAPKVEPRMALAEAEARGETVIAKRAAAAKAAGGKHPGGRPKTAGGYPGPQCGMSRSTWARKKKAKAARPT